MDNEKIGPNQAECAPGCGSVCNCRATGIGKKSKIIICLIVAIAAAVVLAHGIMQKAEAQSDLEQNVSNLSLWANTIDSLASLNQEASPKDAVFLYLPMKGQEPDENVKKEIEAAAGKAQSQGTMTTFYVLDEGSEDYLQLTGQVPAPFVLVMVKGSSMNVVPANVSIEKGMSVVSGDISEENLLYALVAASRPSAGCCALPSTKCC